MASKREALAILMAHKQNLENATTFEEYKKVHVEYVSYLIERHTHEIEGSTIVDKFIEKSIQFIEAATKREHPNG